MFFHDFNSKFHDRLVSQFNSCVNSNKSVSIQTWVAKPKSPNYTLQIYTLTTLLWTCLHQGHNHHVMNHLLISYLEKKSHSLLGPKVYQ